MHSLQLFTNFTKTGVVFMPRLQLELASSVAHSHNGLSMLMTSLSAMVSLLVRNSSISE